MFKQALTPQTQDPTAALQREFDRALSRFFEEGPGLQGPVGHYPVDIREDEKNVYVDAELPGFTKKDIDVRVESGMLNIIAERERESGDNGNQTQHLRERQFTRFQRTFALPSEVDESKADARFEDGVLHLSLPKTEGEKRKQIEVK